MNIHPKALILFFSLTLSLPLISQEQINPSPVSMHDTFRPQRPTVWEITKKHWKKLTGALAVMTTVAIGGFIINLESQRRLSLAKDKSERIIILKDDFEKYQKMVTSIETTIFRYMPNGMNLQKGAQADAQEYRKDIVEGLLGREPLKYQEYVKNPQSLRSLIDEEHWYYIQEAYFKNLFTNYWKIIQARGNDQQKKDLSGIMKENIPQR